MYPDFILIALSGPLRTVVSIVGAMLGLGIVVFVHELGHFIIARRSGMKVEAFSIGFGPILWHKEKDGVDYRLSLIFFGGYCKIAGMEGEDGVPAHEVPGGFFAARPGPRALTLFAGACMNFIFAFLVFTLLWGTGRVMDKSNLSTTVRYIEPGYPAAEAGILPGDKIIEIDGRKTQKWKDVVWATVFSTADTITITLDRDGEEKILEVAPRIDDEIGARRLGISQDTPVIVAKIKKDSVAEKIGLKNKDKVTAIVAGGVTTEIHHVHTFLELIKENIGQEISLKVVRDDSLLDLALIVPEPEEDNEYPRLGFYFGFEKTVRHLNPVAASWEVVETVYYTLRGLFSGSVKAKGMAGPIGIVNLIGSSFLTHWTIFMYLLGFISLNLGIVNLLPIPVLDGGHIMFTLLEAVTKKRIPEKVMTVITNVFAALIITFFLYITFHDIKRLLPDRPEPKSVQVEGDSITIPEPAQ